MPSADSAIPFIDFSEFGDGTSEAAKRISTQLYTACRDVGFLYIVGHGIPQRDIDGIFDMSKKFFELPYDVKMTAPHPKEAWHHRGYSGIGVEQVSQMVFDDDKIEEMRGKGADFKESYDMGSEDSRKCPNVWLEDKYLPGLRSTCLDFQETCKKLENKVLKALALGMPGVPENFFEEYHSGYDNQLRFLHYPSAPRKVFDSGEKGRIAAHTDFGTCTFLFQDDCGGLEVESPHNPGTFLPAPPVHGAIVFNIGDFLMRWSNDELKSTLHRVRAPPPRADDGEMTRERYSIPYFCSADPERVIDALPGTYSETRPKKYAPITSREYITMRMNATYAKY
ncbi:hypothetical protein I203_103660 [Kwoniella mangroviensis CBS 8507]|uniref:uncharacterized protein n=1 Tax=Kwoniella mangroviensis CBS 8507 TaxID=1296122 RepID=UPI00080CC19C|nr:uncharacterized protein I203_04245 [Kwoniella mangroviensis CBS 8507]OCF66669.1 hypothetical protein I203_04245 [Kwoniella mangroviensis CBS 8507]